jgi:hypothetical protein
MSTFPGAEMTREDMREEEREMRGKRTGKGRRYEESTASDYLAEYRMT